MSGHPPYLLPSWRRTVLAFALHLAALPGVSGVAFAFPPYRSTDAGTADPWVVEGRLGMIQWTRDGGDDASSSPLLRLNLGLPAHTELSAEMEYSQDTNRIEDAAVGGKWIPWVSDISLGIEALALLPRSGETRTGFEASLLMTTRTEPLLLHMNAGGFDDRRPEKAEQGWKGSVLLEYLGEVSWRPGIELSAKRIGSEPEQVTAGAGAIVPFDSFDVRFGARFGLTNAAPDVTASLWIGGELPLRSE